MMKMHEKIMAIFSALEHLQLFAYAAIVGIANISNTTGAVAMATALPGSYTCFCISYPISAR